MKNDIGIQIYYRIVISKIVFMIPTLNHGCHQLPIHMCFCLIVEKDVVIGMDVMIMMSWEWKRVVHIDHIGTLQCHRDNLQEYPQDNLRGNQRGNHRRDQRLEGFHLIRRSNLHNTHLTSPHNDHLASPHNNQYKLVPIDMNHQSPQHIRQEVKSRLIQ